MVTVALVAVPNIAVPPPLATVTPVRVTVSMPSSPSATAVAGMAMAMLPLVWPAGMISVSPVAVTTPLVS